MDTSNCPQCKQVSEAKRAAIVAVPLTKPNPKWLRRFQDKARDLLLQRDFSNMVSFDPEHDVGEVWFKGDGWREDEEIIEEACKHADWMRFRRTRLVIGEPTPIVNAFAGHVHQSSSYEDEPGAVKVEREIPDSEGEKRVAYIRAQMPDVCDLHAQYAALLAENMAIKREQMVEDTRTYVKLAQKVAKLHGQELTGKVRMVSFAPFGTVPIQGETVRPMLKPVPNHADKTLRRIMELSAVDEFMKSHPQSGGA